MKTLTKKDVLLVKAKRSLLPPDATHEQIRAVYSIVININLPWFDRVYDDYKKASFPDSAAAYLLTLARTYASSDYERRLYSDLIEFVKRINNDPL